MLVHLPGRRHADGYELLRGRRRFGASHPDPGRVAAATQASGDASSARRG